MRWIVSLLSKPTGPSLLRVSMRKTVEISGTECPMYDYTYSCAEESTGAVLQTTGVDCGTRRTVACSLKTRKSLRARRNIQRFQRRYHRIWYRSAAPVGTQNTIVW